MTKTRKTVSAALAVAIIASSGLFAIPATASAAAMTRIAPAETTANAPINVHYHGGYYGDYGYRPHCFWKRHRIWTYYGPIWKRYRVCY